MPLITFEGADGAGKSTQVAELARRLAARDIPTRVVREPGGTPLGEHIRSLLKDPQLQISPVAELLLFAAARRELIDQQIAPALERGDLVLLDRFTDSTVAYQGEGRRIGVEVVHEVNRIATGGIAPTLTFFLDLTDDVRAVRIGQGGRDRIEQAGDEFYRRVTGAYRTIATSEPRRVVRLEADRPADEIASDILRIMTARGIIPEV